MPQLPLDAQAEVGYKWGITLLKQERREEALKVFTQMLGRLLLSDSASALWIAAVIGCRGLCWRWGNLKAMGDLDAAQRIYQKLIAYNLPGHAYAQDSLSRLGPGDDASAASN